MDDIQLDLWRDLYFMLGTPVAALVGLLFVVASLHLEEIVSNAPYRLRARNNIFYLVIMVVEAALMLTPQPMALLGAEFLVICGALLVFQPAHHVPLSFQGQHARAQRWLPAVSRHPFRVTDLVGIAGAIALIAHSLWGIYLITACYIMSLVSVVLTAWTIMLGIGVAEKKTRVS